MGRGLPVEIFDGTEGMPAVGGCRPAFIGSERRRGEPSPLEESCSCGWGTARAFPDRALAGDPSRLRFLFVVRPVFRLIVNRMILPIVNDVSHHLSQGGAHLFDPNHDLRMLETEDPEDLVCEPLADRPHTVESENELLGLLEAG